MAEESIYYTPDGCIDLPFMYVFDASTPVLLAEDTSPNGRIVPIDGDSDFILRAILGVPFTVDPTGGGMTLYNYSGSRAFSSPITPMSNQYAIVPEKIYPKSGAIKFDLTDIQKANTACATTIFFPQIAFQGVKRYRPNTPGYGIGSPQFPAPYNPDDFTLRPWIYLLDLNLSWFKWIAPAASGIPDIVRTFVIEVMDYDFELHAIQVTDATSGERVALERFQMTLYDSTAKRALSSAPVNVSYWNNNRKEFGNPVWPVPPLVYPVWTQIRVDIGSLVCNTDGLAPYKLQLAFIGVNRVPKVGGPANVNTIGGGGGGA